jgi:ABC-type branched-subunit amino acid transport system substrate-binding protein
MKSPSPSLSLFRGIAVLLFAGALFPGLSLAGLLTPQETRGKSIYRNGAGTSGGGIKAFIGEESWEAPGTVAPCVDCHGRDGRGKPAAGTSPSNITWSELTKPYGATHAYGRKSIAYTDETVARAIARGIDSSGNRLDDAMPRYSIPEEDLGDLLAYLRRLETETDAGLTPDRIRLGTLLPSKGPMAEAGLHVKEILLAFFQEVNRNGGIYRRKIDLFIGDHTGNADATVKELKRLVDEEEVFALVGAFTMGADREVSVFVEREEIPLVGPFSRPIREIDPLNRFAFYLEAPVIDQACSFLEFARKGVPLKNPRIAILYGDEIPSEIPEAVEERGRASGWIIPGKIRWPSDAAGAEKTVRELRAEGTEMVLFFGEWEGFRALIVEADQSGWRPLVYLPGSSVRPGILGIPDGFHKKIHVSFPSLPSDRTPSGMKDFSALLERHDLSREDLTVRIQAYAAAKILVEGLKQAGQELSREKLVAALEKLVEFETGLTPKISFGPNRRVGAMGAYIVTVDLERKTFIPLSDWIAPR